MYTKIVVALDGSELSEGILPYARSFAKTLEIPVELLHVVDPDHFLYSVFAHQGRYYDIMTAEKKRSIDYLSKIATSFSDSTSVDCSVETGNPAEVIVDRAASHAGILIAMTTHGRSGIKRWLLGSVAQKVLHAAVSPLFLVRPTEATATRDTVAPKTLLVPLDGSSLAEKVFPYVVALAKKLSLEVLLFHVYHIPYGVYSGGDGLYGIDFEELTASVRDEANDYLDKKITEMKKLGVEKISYTTKEGLGADEIISLGRKTPDNLIAMCSHGRSGVKRWVLGSVTETVVRHSGEPVLVIRAT